MSECDTVNPGLPPAHVVTRPRSNRLCFRVDGLGRKPVDARDWTSERVNGREVEREGERNVGPRVEGLTLRDKSSDRGSSGRHSRATGRLRVDQEGEGKQPRRQRQLRLSISQSGLSEVLWLTRESEEGRFRGRWC